MLEKMENIRLILGDEKINKMSYSDQLKCLIGGLSYFSEDSEMLTDLQVYILSLFYKQLKKKYPKMSEKRLMSMSGTLFSENKVSTKTNENIKKQVLQEARKFFAKILVKSAQKNKLSKDELHISSINKQDNMEIDESRNFFMALILALAVIFLLVLLLAEYVG